jgi:hypothetical protein
MQNRWASGAVPQMLPQHQVLVLRHPNDDNLDVQLQGDDEGHSMRDCGITHNSVLTLHSLYTCVPQACVRLCITPSVCWLTCSQTSHVFLDSLCSSSSVTAASGR